MDEEEGTNDRRDEGRQEQATTARAEQCQCGNRPLSHSFKHSSTESLALLWHIQTPSPTRTP